MKIVQYGIPRITPALEHFDAVVTHIRKLGRQAQFEPWGALATRLAQVIDERLRNDTNPAHTVEIYVGYAIAIGHLPGGHQVDPWCSLWHNTFGADRVAALAPYFVRAALSQRSRHDRIRMAARLPRYLKYIQDSQLRSRAFDCCLDVAPDVMSRMFTIRLEAGIQALFVRELADELAFRPEECRQFEFDRVADANDALPVEESNGPSIVLARTIPLLPAIDDRPRAFRRIADAADRNWARVGAADSMMELLEVLSRVIPTLPHDSQNAAVAQIIEIVDRRLPTAGRNLFFQILGL